MNSDSTGGFAGLDNSQRSPTRRSVRDFWLSSFVLAGLVISLLAAAGCDGLIVEVHPHPEVAVSDGPQSLRPADFQVMMDKLAEFAKVVGKKL